MYNHISNHVPGVKKKFEVKRFAPVDGSGASLRTVTAIFKTINCYASFFLFLLVETNASPVNITTVHLRPQLK